MFGILIYEILSGKKPHGSAENLVSVAIDIRETGLIPTFDEHVDPFFKQLLIKCCQFEPDQRPVSILVFVCFIIVCLTQKINFQDFDQIIQELVEEKQKNEQ